MSVLDCYQLIETYAHWLKDKEITPDTLHALKAYEIEPMVWSKREGHIEKLVA